LTKDRVKPDGRGMSAGGQPIVGSTMGKDASCWASSEIELRRYSEDQRRIDPIARRRDDLQVRRDVAPGGNATS
jgi:hypothetical protein